MKHSMLMVVVMVMVMSMGQVKAQRTLTGRIMDGSREAIAYASIQLQSEPKGTLSNERGEFSLAVATFPAVVKVSHLGYESRVIEVTSTDDNLVVELQRSAIVLKEIAVSADYPQQLIKSAYEKARRESRANHFGKAFFRQKTQSDSLFTEFSESFYNVKFSSKGIDSWFIENGRYAHRKGEKGDYLFTFSNYSYLTGGFLFYQEKIKDLILPVNRDVDKYYDLEIKSYLQADDGELAEVYCTPRAPYKNKALEGSVFINTTTFAIQGIRGCFRNDWGMTFADKDIEVNDPLICFDIAFRNDRDHRALLDYVQVDTRLRYGKSGAFEKTAHVNSVLIFYEIEKQQTEEKFEKVRRKVKDIDAIKKVKYNPAFWKNNPIIKRLPDEEKAINAFEAANSFGNYFN